MPRASNHAIRLQTISAACVMFGFEIIPTWLISLIYDLMRALRFHQEFAISFGAKDGAFDVASHEISVFERACDTFAGGQLRSRVSSILWFRFPRPQPA